MPTILGAGSWGTALAIHLARTAPTTPVRLWGHDPGHVARLRTEGVNATYLPGVPFPPNLEAVADLAALRAQLVPLQGAWMGDAATAFVGLMARWDADARSLSEALRAIGEAIQGSGRTYQQQEEAQSSGLSAIRVALG